MEELRARYADMLREELTERCAPFWLRGADREYGGILNCLDNEGVPYATDKGVWMQGRTAWTYAHLYRMGDRKEEYLALARDCLAFENAHCFDCDGRMLDTVTREGAPIGKSTGLFSEAFYITACAECFLATGEARYLADARRIYDGTVAILFGEREDPYTVTSSFCTARPTKALCTPMIFLNVTGILRAADPEGTERYNAIADRLLREIRTFHDEKNGVMRETVGADGSFFDEASEGRVVNPGHDLECSWFLLEEGLFRGDREICAFAKTVYDEAMQIGWDSEQGGLMYYRDALGRPMEILDFDMRIWWAHCEGMIAALAMYRTFGEEKYKRDFIRLTDYSLAHFSDRVNGEWYGMLHRDGTPTLPPFKGHTYKGAFHVMRMLMKVLALLDASLA